jgi:membrane dipeptidase
MFIFDAHLDLSMNALQWNRDYTLPVSDIRAREQALGHTDKPDRGRGTTSLPEMRRGRIGLCVATQIAKCSEGVEVLPQVPGYASPAVAWATTQGQLAWYRCMEEAGEMVQICDRAALDRHVALWEGDPPDDTPIGYILSLEGADSFITPQYLERAYAYGLRAVGPTHYGPGRYAAGTAWEGGFTPAGRELLKEMERLNIICDITHLTDEGIQEAFDLYSGPLWASHSNCRALCPAQRQLSDEQIKILIERDAVIGVVFDAWMLIPGWVRGESNPAEAGVALKHIADNIDHICQLAGNTQHVGIGSDLDGGFGTEQGPTDLDTIADLQKLEGILSARGYSEADIAGIFHGNWLRFLRKWW